MMKKLLFTVALVAMCQFSNAQFALGDIAFSAYSADSATPDDSFTFVILRDVLVGEELIFDENGWFFNLGGLRTTEGKFTFTFGNAYPAGTQIVISKDPFQALDQNGGSAGTLAGTALNLATGGDNIFAYNTGATPTTADDSGFIAAINMTGAWSPSGSLPGSTTTTEKPNILTEGLNAISIEPEVDNARILLAKCSSFSDITTLRNMLNSATNWEIQDSGAFPQSPPLCNFVFTLGISDQELSSSNVQLMPNPTNTTFNVIASNGYTLSSLDIIDMTGKQVLSVSQFSEGNRIDVSALNAGVYMVRVTSNENTIIKKLVKN